MMDEKKRVWPLWRKIVLGMGQKAGKCKEAVEIGMIGPLRGIGVGAGCVVRQTAGRQTMPGSVRQPAALARTTPTRWRRCGRVVKKMKMKV
jgi:hypothetical protein